MGRRPRIGGQFDGVTLRCRRVGTLSLKQRTGRVKPEARRIRRMNATYAADNMIQRQRLFALTTEWTETDLTRQLTNGWSVATKLAHLAI